MEKILKEIVDRTCQLMKYVTIKENYDEFYKAFELVKEELKNYQIQEIIVGKYPNLVISNTTSHELDLIFCGHMDVVPNESYEAIIEGNIIKGRGSFDMKSQLSVIISLLKHNVSKKKVAFIITSDEELGGECCKEILKDYTANLAVIPDAGKNFQLITDEKGLLQVEIKVYGKGAHASSPFSGENAILKAMNIYEQLLKLYPMPKSEEDFITSINLSKLHGGETNNKVCDCATMFLDIRFTKETSREKLLQDIQNVMGNSELKVIDYGPMFTMNPDIKEIQKFRNDSQKILGRKVELSKCLATSDAIYFSEKDIPCILINPKGDFWHHPNEYMEIDSLYTLYLLFKTLI